MNKNKDREILTTRKRYVWNGVFLTWFGISAAYALDDILAKHWGFAIFNLLLAGVALWAALKTDDRNNYVWDASDDQ